MPEVAVHNLKGKKVGSMTLNETLWTSSTSDHLVWEVVRAYLANQRQGTAKTKNRSEMSGGAGKPWRQKGTGRARVGSSRSPLWTSGGTVHGPRPRSYYVPIPKRKRRLALSRVLTDLLAEDRVLVLDEIELESHRTKEFVDVLKSLKLTGKTLMVDSGENHKLHLACRNLQGIGMSRPEDLNAYEVLRYEHITISKDAVLRLEEVMSS